MTNLMGKQKIKISNKCYISFICDVGGPFHSTPKSSWRHNKIHNTSLGKGGGGGGTHPTSCEANRPRTHKKNQNTFHIMVSKNLT